MEEQQKNIEEAFRESLSGYREAPPAAAWEAVRARLDADKGRRRRFFAWWVWASLLLMLVGGTWLVAEQIGGEKNNVQRGVQNSASVPTSPASSAGTGQPIAARRGLAVPDSGKDASVDTVAKEERKIAASAEEEIAKASNSEIGNSASRKSSQKQHAGKRNSVARVERTPIARRTSSSSRRASRATRTANALRNSSDSVSELPVQRRKPRSQASEEKAVSSVKKPAPLNRQSHTRVADSTRISQRRRAAEKTAKAKPVNASSARPASGQAKSSSHSIADSSRMQVAVRKREEELRKQSPPVAAADVRAKSPSIADSAPKARKPKTDVAKMKPSVATTSKTAAVKPKAEIAKIATNTTPSKTADVEIPAAQKAASGDLKPSTPTKGAVESIAAAGVNTVANSSAPNNPAAVAGTVTDNNRGAPGIPLLPYLTPGSDSSAMRQSPPATAGGGGGGGVGNDDIEEERPDTMANPARKRRTRFSLTPLAGYELGTTGAAPNRLASSLRLLYQFDRDWSVGVQPAYRSSTVKNVTLQAPGTFQGDFSPVQVDSFFVPDSNGTIFGTRYYYISQDFDSIVTPGRSVGGRLWEVELPLMVRYTVPRTGFYVYGGPTLVFGGRLTSNVTGSVQTYSAQRRDTIILPNQLPPAMGGGGLPADTFTDYFGTSSLPPFSSYDSTTGAFIPPSAIRYGYMFGLGYDWRRVVLDVSVHKQVSGYSDVNTVLRDVFASPYVRLSLGYRFGGGSTGGGARRKRVRGTGEKNFLQRF